MKYYSLIGQTVVECGFWEWVMMFERIANRRVRLTRIGPFSVSTVFLGIDHSFGYGPPLLFETMTFLEADTPEVRDFEGRNDCDGRWSTWAEAERAHDLAVQFLQNEFCHPGEQPVEIEDNPVPVTLTCARCGHQIERGPYFSRRIKRHLGSHKTNDRPRAF